MTFRRCHFQGHFHQRKCLISDWNITEACSLGSNKQYSTIGSDNGLAPSRRQAIIWTLVLLFSIDVFLTLSYIIFILTGPLGTWTLAISSLLFGSQGMDFILYVPLKQEHISCLTWKQLDTHGSVHRTVATDALLKHQGMSIHRVD